METDPLDTIWLKIRAAFAHYGVTTRGKLSAGRRQILQRHLDDGIELSELPMAIHGYVRQHKGLSTPFSNGQLSGDYMTFETCFKLEKMELRVELGAQGPWEKPLSHEEAVKARQRAGKAKLVAARAEKDKPRLKVVE